MTAPTPPAYKLPSTRGYVSALARNWACQVDTNYGTSEEEANWENLLGLTKLGPSNTPGMVDDSDLNSGGWDSQTTTTQAGVLTIEGIYKGPKVAGKVVLPPALLYMRLIGRGIGEDNTGHFRFWRTDDVDIAEEIYGPVNWTEGTEDRRGLFIYTSNVTYSGEPLLIEKPTSKNSVSVPKGDPTP